MEQSAQDTGYERKWREMIAGRDLFTGNLLFQETETLNQSGINTNGIYCSMWLKLGGDII